MLLYYVNYKNCGALSIHGWKCKGQYVITALVKHKYDCVYNLFPGLMKLNNNM